MANPFLGEIRVFSFNFNPKGWALCNGQLLAINQYQALFALLGTSYGGNGTTNFQLPNLQSRVPMHQGNGGGGSYVMGQLGGVESVALNSQQMPQHYHSEMASATPALVRPAVGHQFANPVSTATQFFSAATNLVQLAPQSMTSTGNGVAHENRQPYLTLNFCISLVGIFPSRN